LSGPGWRSKRSIRIEIPSSGLGRVSLLCPSGSDLGGGGGGRRRSRSSLVPSFSIPPACGRYEGRGRQMENSRAVRPVRGAPGPRWLGAISSRLRAVQVPSSWSGNPPVTFSLTAESLPDRAFVFLNAIWS
jgi:hypothetical protein